MSTATLRGHDKLLAQPAFCTLLLCKPPAAWDHHHGYLGSQAPASVDGWPLAAREQFWSWWQYLNNPQDAGLTHPAGLPKWVMMLLRRQQCISRKTNYFWCKSHAGTWTGDVSLRLSTGGRAHSAWKATKVKKVNYAQESVTGCFRCPPLASDPLDPDVCRAGTLANDPLDPDVSRAGTLGRLAPCRAYTASRLR